MSLLAIIGRRRLVIFLCAYLAFLILMGGIGYFIGRSDSKAMPVSVFDRSFYNMRRTSINVGGSFTAAHGAIRTAISLEIEEKDADLINNYAPRIMDRVQNYMGSVPIDDLRGSASLEWLRRELLWEVNQASGPVRIFSVNFREFLLVK